MGNNSPLGAFAAPVAAIAAIGIIGAYLASLFLPGMDAIARTNIQDAAFVALGAVFGSAVAVNGYKAPLTSAHARLDKLQSAITATAAGSGDPLTVSNVAAILEDNRPDPDHAPAPPSMPSGS
jgi:hypothetical protein